MKNTGQNPPNTPQSEVDSKLSAVASNPRKSGIVLVVLVITAVYLIYNFVWKGRYSKDKAPNEVSKKVETVEAPKLDANININNAPLLPEPPELQAPEAPPAPDMVHDLPPAPVQPATIIPETVLNTPPVVGPPTIETPTLIPSPSYTGKVSLQDRRRSGIMALGGRGGGGGGGDGDRVDNQAAATSTENNADRAPNNANNLNKADAGPYIPPVSTNFTPSRTTFAQQRITRLGDLRYIVAQGKIIEAVLETGISTEHPGVVRAIVSRDIYSEAGKNVLVPKGSRLIGAFLSDTGAGGVRIAIAWNRLIRPDGVDVAVESPAIDNLGRAGIKAEVDSKLFDLISNSLLTSTIKIAVAKAGEKWLNAGNYTETNTTTPAGETSNTKSGSPSTFAVKGAVDDLGNVITTATKRLVDAKPTLHLHQGTALKVFVNRDLIFSSSFEYGGKVVQ